MPLAFADDSATGYTMEQDYQETTAGRPLKSKFASAAMQGVMTDGDAEDGELMDSMKGLRATSFKAARSAHSSGKLMRLQAANAARTSGDQDDHNPNVSPQSPLTWFGEDSGAVPSSPAKPRTGPRVGFAQEEAAAPTGSFTYAPNSNPASPARPNRGFPRPSLFQEQEAVDSRQGSVHGSVNSCNLYTNNSAASPRTSPPHQAHGHAHTTGGFGIGSHGPMDHLGSEGRPEKSPGSGGLGSIFRAKRGKSSGKVCAAPMNRVRVENVHDAQMELQQQSHHAMEDRHRTSAGDVSTPTHRSRLRQGSASITAPETLDQYEMEMTRMLSCGQASDAVYLPGPHRGLMRCFIKRSKPMFGSDTYYMFADQEQQFLLAARRRKKTKSPSYVIATSETELTRDADACVAKLKANFTGSEFMLWSKGSSSAVKKGFGAEAMCVAFQSTPLLSFKGQPRVMHVCCPQSGRPMAGNGGGQSDEEEDEEDEEDSGEKKGGFFSRGKKKEKKKALVPKEQEKQSQLSEVLEMAKKGADINAIRSGITLLRSAEPLYDEDTKGYILDFNGRVKEPSAKNFQLVQWDGVNSDESTIMMQFGKAKKDEYILDFRYPLSAATAFAIALASADPKLCYALG